MSIDKLVNIMQQLRDPQEGCPWDREQTLETIVPHTIEEAYEVADAIAQGDMDELKHELGDLLFQVVFYSQIASEQALFDFSAVTDAICEKMVRRHPHVFAGEMISDVRQQTEAWEKIKAEERRDKSVMGSPSLLAGVARSLPAMIRAAKLQKRAAKVQFDWTDVADVRDKVAEELSELDLELKQGVVDRGRLEEEVGDLLFSCVNLSRHLGVDAEAALHRANAKFMRRFAAIEGKLEARGAQVAEVGPVELERLWALVKQEEIGA